MTLVVDSSARPLIERTTTPPIWPSRWLQQILVNIRLRQRDPTKSHQFSLGHILRGYAFDAAIRITYGDRDGGDEDGRDGLRSTVKSGGCCAAKTTPPYKTIALRVLQHPLSPAKQFLLNQIDHREPFAQQKRRPWSIDAD